MRIFLMEHLKDLLCMSMIFGKDNCLADLFPVIDLQPLCHHRLQNFPNGIFVKDPGVQRRRANSFRKISIFINEILLVFLFFFIRQFVINFTLFSYVCVLADREVCHDDW